MEKEIAKKLKVGDRVAAFEDYNGELTSKIVKHGDCGLALGTIEKVLIKNKITVRWDDVWFNTSKYSETTGEITGYDAVDVNISLLFLPKEAKQKMSVMEKEYKVLVKQAAGKLKEASKLIKEANKIAKQAGTDNLCDMYEANDILMSTLDSCGWQTSSMGC